MTGDISQFDKAHIDHLDSYARKIRKVYAKKIDEAIKLALLATPIADAVFSFSNYPQLKKQVERLFAEMNDEIHSVISSGIESEWALSNMKNNTLVYSVFAGSKVSQKALERFYQSNTPALTAFLERKTNELGLSGRVWRHTEQFKQEIELALSVSIAEGGSAASISRAVRGLLNEPNKLFRRVRDQYGDLVLSQPAKAYHPGQGVYRSSYKNALRLTRTETNMAYRAADYARWGQLDFVIGMRISLSNNHTINGVPFFDICDELQGVYPKDFKFVGWHPNCRCIATPEILTTQQFERYEELLMNGEDADGYADSLRIKSMPTGFGRWIGKNAERIAKAKSTPYFIRDNFKGGKISKGLRF